MRNLNNKEVKTQKKKRRKTNLDIDQCIDIWWVLNKHVMEIKSLSLQKLVIVTIVGFFSVSFPSLMLLLVMVVVIFVVVTVQE
jgi:hypothetical protein